MLAVALPVAGAGLDELLGFGLGWAFVVASVLGAVVAVLACPRTGLWRVITAPPLVLAVVTVVVELLAGTSSMQGRKGLTTEVVGWAVDGFPAMAAAETTVLVMMAVRMVRSKRGGRNRGA